MSDPNRRTQDIHDPRWLRANRSTLRLCGLPDEITEKFKNWNYFLNHGDLLGLSWSPDFITVIQASRLLELIESNSEDTLGISCINDLKKRIEKPDPQN